MRSNVRDNNGEIENKFNEAENYDYDNYDNYSGEVLYVTSNTKNAKNNFIYSVFLNYEISRRYIVLIFPKGSFKSNEYYNPDKSSE